MRWISLKAGIETRSASFAEAMGTGLKRAPQASLRPLLKAGIETRSASFAEAMGTINRSLLMADKSAMGTINRPLLSFGPGTAQHAYAYLRLDAPEQQLPA